MDEGRPRLLFLSHLLPFPYESGASIRTGNVLRILSRRFAVTALCFTRPTASGASDEERAAGLRQYAEIRHFRVPAQGNRRRTVWDHLRSVVAGRPWVWYHYDSRDYRANLRKVLADGHFDMVHVDSLDLVTYLPELSLRPRVCVHHNVESELLLARSKSERSTLARVYLRWQSRLLREAERTWCPDVDLNVVVSSKDGDALGSLAPSARFVVYPNGVDTDHYQPVITETPGGDLVFVGGTTWFPNADALSHYKDAILPALSTTGPIPSLTWVGSTTDADRGRFSAVPGLSLTGYVEDERPHVRAARCFVVPLRVGGGTRLKILNAWAMGRAVVSTSLGCEGLDARHGENILIADEPADFATEVRRVLDDEALRRRLEAGGRRTAVELYSWEVIGRGMLATYEDLLRHSGCPAEV